MRKAVLSLLLGAACLSLLSAQSSIDDLKRLVGQELATLAYDQLDPIKKKALDDLMLKIANRQQGAITPSAGAATKPSTFGFYDGKIDEVDDDIVKLVDGSVVQITSGYVGYVGYGKRTILYQSGNAWKIWIQGKKSFGCDVIKSGFSRRNSGTLTSISRVLGDGHFIKVADGTLYEVGDYYAYFARNLAYVSYNVLIIGDYELIGLDSGEDPIEVTRVRE